MSCSRSSWSKYVSGGSSSSPNGARVVLASPPDACSGLQNAAAMNGTIALIQRGTCSFSDKVKRAQDAGALAVLIANNLPCAGYVFMSDSGVNAGAVTIPVGAIRFEQNSNVFLISIIHFFRLVFELATARDCF